MDKLGSMMLACLPARCVRACAPQVPGLAAGHHTHTQASKQSTGGARACPHACLGRQGRQADRQASRRAVGRPRISAQKQKGKKFGKEQAADIVWRRASASRPYV
ncbi:hypothetical protein BC567DRAFT_232699, partial [Phyllosticta citribraziliensis]